MGNLQSYLERKPSIHPFSYTYPIQELEPIPAAKGQMEEYTLEN